MIWLVWGFARLAMAFSVQASNTQIRPMPTPSVLTAASRHATPVGDQSISLELAPARPKSATVAEGPGGGPLPASVERAPGEDGFELVPLKYADVSEVVGLLTDGLTVKSNNAFTPREPAF